MGALDRELAESLEEFEVAMAGEQVRVAGQDAEQRDSGGSGAELPSGGGSAGALPMSGLTYIFRSLRGLFVAGRFLAFHKFHFLLYICTVEIAPVLILIKLIFKQL